MTVPADSSTERWNDIPGFEGVYLGSTCGRVFAQERTVEWNGTTRRLKARHLTGNRRTGQFHLSWNGEHRMLSRQAVVLMTFVRLPEADEVAVVRDERQPISLGNVEWQTHSAFRLDVCKTSGKRKLTARKVRAIRRRDIANWREACALADEFGTTVSTVYRLRRGETWPGVS